MATYAIGDIQGCYDELQALLDRIRFGPGDRLWFTGDLVNRGPKSLECLRFVRDLGERAVTVLGNHDLHLLAVAWHGERKSRKDTLDPILNAPDRYELLEWLRRQPLLHYDKALDTVMVHAGIPPNWSLKKARACAREVEAILHSDCIGRYFRHMYGNEPARWKEELEGWDRLRLITNYLTRMRFCDARGRLELTTKTGPAAPPKGYAPWYSFEARKSAEVQVVFGHWASLEGKAKARNVHALDTGCIWGGKLTAMRLEDGERYSVKCKGYA